MKLHLINRKNTFDRSFSVSHHIYKNFLKIWHFHEEFELVLILQSSGTRFVGDSIERFDVGDLVLLGENVPHMWQNSEEYFTENSTKTAEAISIHFNRDFLGKGFFGIPEMRKVQKLLNASSRGIKFSNINDDLINKINDLLKLEIPARIPKIIEIFQHMASLEDYQLLTSIGFVHKFQQPENRRLYKIHEFVFENFSTPIRSSDLANIIGMNNSSFSRYFKKTHQKTFTRYLNEIRVGYACKLLLEGKESVTSIAYLSGYNNISNFNRQFRLIKGQSPSEFLNYHNLVK